MKIFLSIVCTVLLCSCNNTFYQIMDTSCRSCVKSKGTYLSSTDSVYIEYYFWNDGGVMAFVVHNTLNRPIYIDWKKSGFMVRGQLFTYWQDKTTIVSAGGSITQSYGVRKYFMMSNPTIVDARIQGSTTASATIISNPERISFVVGNSKYKSPYVYPLLESGFYYLPDDQFTKEYKDTSSTGKVLSVFAREYTEENTTMAFRNYITWTESENAEIGTTIDNSFYISKITEIPSVLYSSKYTNNYPTKIYKYINKPGYSITDRRNMITTTYQQ